MGVRPLCSLRGENCALSQCCAAAGMKCYKKHDHFSMCNRTCNPNNKWTDDGWVTTSEKVWNCEDISRFTIAGTAKTVHAADTKDSTASASSSSASTAAKNSSNASTASASSSNGSTASEISSNASAASASSSSASTASGGNSNASTASENSSNVSTASENIFVHSKGASVASGSSNDSSHHHLVPLSTAATTAASRQSESHSGTASSFLCFALSVGFANSISPFLL